MEALGLSDGFVLAFVQVVLIDLVMSGDNAIIIGLAVAGLPAENRGPDHLLGRGRRDRAAHAASPRSPPSCWRSSG